MTLPIPDPNKLQFSDDDIPRRQGAPKKDNPWVPVVQKVWDQRNNKPLAKYEITLNGESANDKKNQLKTIEGLIRRAGNEVKPEAVSVIVRPSTIDADGKVELKIKTVEKIRRPRYNNEDNAPAVEKKVDKPTEKPTEKTSLPTPPKATTPTTPKPHNTARS